MGSIFLLDEMDLADVPDDQYWELYAVLDKMVSDFRSRFPDFGGSRCLSSAAIREKSSDEER